MESQENLRKSIKNLLIGVGKYYEKKDVARFIGETVKWVDDIENQKVTKRHKQRLEKVVNAFDEKKKVRWVRNKEARELIWKLREQGVTHRNISRKLGKYDNWTNSLMFGQTSVSESDLRTIRGLEPKELNVPSLVEERDKTIEEQRQEIAVLKRNIDKLKDQIVSMGKG